MKYLILVLALASCGQVQPHSVGEEAVSGIHVDMTVQDDLKQQFKDVQECTGIYQGAFEELAIVMMPTVFYCVTGERCNGEFTTPNTIKLGNPLSWRHEVIHYLLYVSTGDFNGSHDSVFFRDGRDGLGCI